VSTNYTKLKMQLRKHF